MSKSLHLYTLAVVGWGGVGRAMCAYISFLFFCSDCKSNNTISGWGHLFNKFFLFVIVYSFLLKIAILLAFIICFISCTEVYLNAKKTIVVIDTTFTVAKRKPEKNSGLYGTPDLRGTGAAFVFSSRLSFRNSKSCVHNCDGLLCI